MVEHVQQCYINKVTTNMMCCIIMAWSSIFHKRVVILTNGMMGSTPMVDVPHGIQTIYYIDGFQYTFYGGHWSILYEPLGVPFSAQQKSSKLLNQRWSRTCWMNLFHPLSCSQKFMDDGCMSCIIRHSIHVLQLCVIPYKSFKWLSYRIYGL